MRFKKLYTGLLTCLTLISCLQTENSSSMDSSVTGSPEFMAARTVFLSSCANCHDFHLLYEEELIARGDVVPGDAFNSPLYYRLAGSLGSEGPKDMPDGGGQLSATEVALVQTWIDNITP